MGGIFDLPNKEKRIKELEAQVNNPDFWQDVNNANNVNKELTGIKKDVSLYYKLNDVLKSVEELINSDIDESMYSLIDEEMNYLKKELEFLEDSLVLGGEFDHLNAFLEIHPGAGGTEACDWAYMLARMYERFAMNSRFDWRVLEEQKGEEAGFKSITIKFIGENAYGYLKNETGVHRLVRISPFDAGGRRHTSFASVSVMPEINKEINIELKDEDLKIDVYHSSGAGGQSVNTSNSAVRITHIPTKTVVTCQNERSQLKNKEMALKMLKNKLYMQELEKEKESNMALKGENVAINFGSQIRSYILEPYKLVKDHRTNFESSEPEKILDGDIMEMLTFNLKELYKVKNK